MFAFKKKYFLIIESIKDIDLRNIKKRNKFIIIYRTFRKYEDISALTTFRKKCKLLGARFFVANDLKLAVKLKADGIYLSAKNTSLKSLNLKRSNFTLIGSAHNIKEISFKKKQGCKNILLSRSKTPLLKANRCILVSNLFSKISSSHNNPCRSVKILFL